MSMRVLTGWLGRRLTTYRDTGMREIKSKLCLSILSNFTFNTDMINSLSFLFHSLMLLISLHTVRGQGRKDNRAKESHGV